MTLNLKQGLTQLIRNSDRPTTPEELARRGIRRVRFVSVDQIVALMEASLERRWREWKDELARLDPTAQLVRDCDDLGALEARMAREQLVLEAQAEVTRSELLAQQTALETRREQARHDTADHAVTDAGALAAAIRDRFQAHGAAGHVDLIRDIVALTQDAIVAELRKAEAAAAAEHAEVDLLERRVRKLVQSLEETEHELARVAKLKEIDAGIASLYRTVQGLDGGEDSAEHKRQMMAAIFQANLEFRGASNRGAARDGGGAIGPDRPAAEDDRPKKGRHKK